MLPDEYTFEALMGVINDIIGTGIGAAVVAAVLGIMLASLALDVIVDKARKILGLRGIEQGEYDYEDD